MTQTVRSRNSYCKVLPVGEILPRPCRLPDWGSSAGAPTGPGRCPARLNSGLLLQKTPSPAPSLK